MRLLKLCALCTALGLGAGLLCALPSCGKQAEGQRCDVLAGDSDCEDNLVCTAKDTLGTLSDICCPPAGVAPTDLACAGGLRQDAGTGGSGGGTGGGGAGGSGGGTGGGGTGGSGGGIGGGGHGGTGGSGGGTGGGGHGGTGGHGGG